MAYEQKDNSGSLFKNDKGGIETRPDYTGTATINGEKLRIGAWIKESSSGKKYMSLSFQPDAEKPKQDAPKKDPARNFDDMESNIPF